MKKSKLLLVFALLVCGVGQAFGQKYAFEVERDFQALIAKAIMFSSSTDEIDAQVDVICANYGKKGYVALSNTADKDYWKGKANKVFEKSKKELEKLDEKIAKGKSISADDAYEAATLYSLGYAPICAQNYQKAADFYNMVGDDASLAVKLNGKCCLYKTTGDKTPAISLVESIDLKELQSNKTDLLPIAVKYGLENEFNDVFKKKTAEFIAANEQTIKRAVRSKNWEQLVSFSDFGIREVDSMLCVDSPYNERSLYWEKCREHGHVFGYTEDHETVVEYLTTTKDFLQIFEYNIADKLIDDVNVDFDRLNEKEYKILISAIKNDPYAGLIVGAAQMGRICYLGNPAVAAEDYAGNTKKIMQILVKKIPEILTWKDCPLLIKADGTFQVKQSLKDDYLKKYNHGINGCYDAYRAIVQPIVNYCKTIRNKK